MSGTEFLSRPAKVSAVTVDESVLSSRSTPSDRFDNDVGTVSSNDGSGQVGRWQMVAVFPETQTLSA